MAKFPELAGKRVMVTGAASGIGYATAERFAFEGASVFLVDRDSKALAAAAAKHENFSGSYAADVASEEQVKSSFLAMDDSLGGIDVLVSNAGISVRSDFVNITYEQWKRVMDINLGGMFLTSKEAAIRMTAQGNGVILMTASSNGTEGHRWYADYNSSKAGVILLTKTMALELAPNVRVNCVCPGYVLTPMQRAEYTDEMLAKTNEGIPMKRHAEPEEIGALYAFLASDDARYITGADIRIDGGETAGLFS
ncbi:MAG: SDR family oxidoreductase [Synergistaceae bacterium]|jgi:NAD(P)-dependent dehydrogenase (short-subunit alcohol dehydrogenase family)|nr:SDR family oxidoreductase [Synergistaceae bacterium]